MQSNLDPNFLGEIVKSQRGFESPEMILVNHLVRAKGVRAWLNCNAMFYKTFICFYVSEAKPLCFSLCSQMFDDVERCRIYNIQNVCHANERLSLCYFFSINVI